MKHRNIREGEFLKELGEECGFYSKEDKVVPKVEDVSLVDVVFDGALSGDEDKDFPKRYGGLNDEACVKDMEVEEEEEEEKYGKDDEENEDEDCLIKMRWINLEKHGYKGLKTLEEFYLTKSRHNERYLHHSHHYHHRCDERMMDDRRRRKRKRKWKDDLFSYNNPFASFAHSEE
uniref:Uncharacterized protein n=1 Tax=Tanacetum cinerariifolium TaxID=118510 RepID=A0A699HH97_TANCI|nr:hypothetical protein [Tanacetum cinerariifolium]